MRKIINSIDNFLINKRWTLLKVSLILSTIIVLIVTALEIFFGGESKLNKEFLFGVFSMFIGPVACIYSSNMIFYKN